MTKLYTDEEINVIKENYAKSDWDELLSMLPGRTKNSISNKARQLGINKNEIKNTLEYVKEQTRDLPYTIIEDSFTTIGDGFEAITDEGYRVIVTSSNFYRKDVPNAFFISNPYTIQNIKQYLKNNNIELELLSEEYPGSNSPMLWRCKCGKPFEMTWHKLLSGKYMCNDCGAKEGIRKRKIDLDEVNENLEKGGFHILHLDNSLPITHSRFDAEDNDGYRYKFSYPSYIYGQRPLKFSTSNPHTIYNINRYLELTGRQDYKCISEEYLGHQEPLDFMHIPCGTIFKTTLNNIQKKSLDGENKLYYKMCPNCHRKKTESYHALVLKQVFMHEYPGSIPEEKSCVNPETGRVLPTDIVNHDLKIAVEIQSDFHDRDFVQKRDKIKKKYWIDKGYSFYDPDIRDYSVIEMIQIFFPYIDSIPDYVDFNFSDCLDFTVVQEYLDESYTIKEISDITGYKIGALHGAIQGKRVILPDGYKEKVHGIHKIVQLDTKGKYMNTFLNLTEASKSGNYSRGYLSKTVRSEKKKAYNYYWIYEEDYLSGNYSLPFQKSA